MDCPGTRAQAKEIADFKLRLESVVNRVFIVFEGTDGSGKQTQTELLVKNLRDRVSLPARRISFPNYGSVGCKLVESYLHGYFGNDLRVRDPYLVSSFYAIDRALSASEWADDAVSTHSIIVADRYFGSNAIYQAAHLEHPAERQAMFAWVYDLEIRKFKLPVPDITFFLDVSAECSRKMMSTRSETDINESNFKLQQQARSTGLKAADYFGWHIIHCNDKQNSMRTVEGIQEEILNHLSSKLIHLIAMRRGIV